MPKHTIEIGLFGREGMSAPCLASLSTQTPHECVVQSEGYGARIAVEHLFAAMAQSNSLTHTLARYAYAFGVQVSETAVSNGLFTIENCLARWLLMSSDRLGSSEIVLTHEYISIMLGVQRPGVTGALHILEGEGNIRALRGQISIVDRPALLALAGQSYGVCEAEYQRVIGPF